MARFQSNPTASSSASRFRNHTTNQQLTIACAMADALLSSKTSKLYRALDERTDFFMWSRKNKKSEQCSPQEAALRLFTGPTGVEVLTYRPWNMFTSTIAMTKKGDNRIYFNIYKLGNAEGLSLIATLLHEYSHKCGFGHGNNYKTNYKCMVSLPYWLSENTARFM